MTTPTAERVQKHRQSLRDAGLRPVQIGAPDTRRPGFAAECRRQSLSVAVQAGEDELQRLPVRRPIVQAPNGIRWAPSPGQGSVLPDGGR